MSLVALLPATRTVALGRATVEVSGLSLRTCGLLAADHPELVELAAGGKFDLAGLLRDGPALALLIFSLGVTDVPQRRRWWRFWNRPTPDGDGRDALIAAFDRVAMGQQLAALHAIVSLTFAGGERAVPFVQSLLASVNQKSPDPDPGANSSADTAASSSD